MSIIILDTETTGLPENDIRPLAVQPHIIEFAARKLTDTWKRQRGKDSISFLLKPPIRGELDPVVTEGTGLTMESLKDAQPFAAHYGALCEFFLGCTTMVAHNLPFDVQLLTYELRRIDKLVQFPWASRHVDIVDVTQHITGKYLALPELYAFLFDGRNPEQKHRALGDVDILTEIVLELVRRGDLK